MKCGPENCPVMAWPTLSAKDQAAKRKAKARELYDLKFTLEQIAPMLGVSIGTIHNDLSSFSEIEKLEPRVSKRGRKGEGRPKGKKNKPKPRAPYQDTDFDDESDPDPDADRKAVTVYAGQGLEIAEHLARIISRPGALTKSGRDEIIRAAEAWHKLSAQMKG